LRLASLSYNALKVTGLTSLARRLRGGGVILCYHNVVADEADSARGDAGLHLPTSSFAQQIRWLKAHYDLISLRQFIERLARGRPLQGAAAITFDDGYCGVFRHGWPLLRALGVPATVFIVADKPDDRTAFWWDHPDVARHATPEVRTRWLGELGGDGARIIATLPTQTNATLAPDRHPADWEAIRAAAASGLALGAHSATHRTLTLLNTSEFEREVAACRDVIHAQTDVNPEFFAYPYGLWDPRVRDAVRGAGYRGAVTLDYGFNGRGADAWALRRINVPASISQPAFEAWVAGLRPGWPTRA
jgi:peptidoglycan/xylan/chitin deacetylase (PgdA/CDA1 family)